MRVRFLNLDLSSKIIIINNLRYSEGDIICLPDDIAIGYIQEKIVEAYNYPISDDEISRLHEEFIGPSDFNRKVEILIYSYSNSIQKAVLEDGTRFSFELDPQTPVEWYCYNSQLIEYYKNKSPNFSMEGLKKEFEKKQFNAPDQSRLIDSEFVRIKKTVKDKFREGISFWYNATYSGDIPRDEDDYKLFLSNHIKFGLETFLQGRALAEYEGFLDSYDTKLKKHDKSKGKGEVFTTLSQVFKDESEYMKVMDLLVNEKYCDEETHIWIDEKTNTKKILATLIKQLHSKNYYKTNLKNNEVKSIAKNTFRIDMGIDTVKQTKPSDHKFTFRFIPPSNLPE